MFEAVTVREKSTCHKKKTYETTSSHFGTHVQRGQIRENTRVPRKTLQTKSGKVILSE